MRRSVSVFAVLLALAALLAAPACAMSDAEYREMMKDPAFAAADEQLNKAWKAVVGRPGAGRAEIAALKKDQRDWVAKGRDAEAKSMMAEGLSAVTAYTRATEIRTELLPDIADRLHLMAAPKGVQGWYVRREGGRETGWLSVAWLDNEESVRVKTEAILVLRPDNVRSGTWESTGRVEKNTVRLSDEDNGNCTMEIVFKGDRATVKTSDGFTQNGLLGMGVTLDGIYVRQKLGK